MENGYELKLPEEWRDVPGFEGYQASSHGRIRSSRLSRGVRWDVLNPKPGDKGYIWTMLRVDGESVHVMFHQLVALAFHGPRPEGYLIDHRDTVKTHNWPSNLEYVTPVVNNRRARAAGLCPGPPMMFGEDNPLAIFTEVEVVAMRERYARNEVTQVELAKEKGCRQCLISSIITGRSWKKAGGPITKGRRLGELNANSKLSDQRREEIRNRYFSDPPISQAALARQNGVSQMTISLIVRQQPKSPIGGP